MNHNYCVILAGGQGSKLWPVSRMNFPKQFLEQAGTGRTFFQNTVARCLSIVPPENILVVTTDRHKELVYGQAPDLPRENILVEPHHRNTAPGVAYATYTLLKMDPEAVFAVIPSDNVITDDGAFRADILSAMSFVAANDALVTMGAKPDRPDHNYGYIQAAGGKDASSKGEPLRVKTFTEKPDVEIARVFIASGEFLWNTGIFVWKASVVKDEMEQLMPEMCSWFGGWEKALGTSVESEFIARTYSGLQKWSINTGIMENTSKAWVYPADFGWADIGTWDSMYNYIKDKDADGNWLGDTSIVKDCRNTFAVSTHPGKLIAAKGLEGYVIVDTDDVLMICPRTDEDAKELSSCRALPRFERFK